MIRRRLSLYLMVTSMWIFGKAFRGPHHPSRSQIQHQDHAHPTLNRSRKIIDDTKVIHDQRHIAEDLGQSKFYRKENLSDVEKDFQFFKLHDFDSNMKLDGIELYQAIMHQLEISEIHLSAERDEKNQEKEDEEENLARLIDDTLEECDINNDGYLSYLEYMKGRARAYARNVKSDEI